MATGTVKYSARMADNEEIYNGGSAKTWKVTQTGSFPKSKYTVSSAVITFNVKSVYATNRHMKVYRMENNYKCTELGDVKTGTAGKHTENLSTSVNYEGITRIKLDGVERWACCLLVGSYVEITVTWTDEVTVKEDPPTKQGGSKTGKTQTQTKKQAKKKTAATGKKKNDSVKGKAREATLDVAIEGVNISNKLSKYLLTMSYTDNEEDETDDLQIKLQDKDLTWLTKWLDDVIQKAAAIKYAKTVKSTKGLKISASICVATPDGIERTINCGTFELDNIKAAGPPATVTIKGTSLPYGNGIRTEERDKAWEGYTLMKIGKEIAKTTGLGYLYDAKMDPNYRRIEQAKQTDIAFLMDLCHRNGLSLKVSNDKLVIYDQSRYEDMKEVSTIKWMDGTYTKYDMSTQDGAVHFDACTVRYYHPGKKQEIEGSAYTEDYDKDAEENLVMVITNERVESVAQAQDLAAKMLRLQNKYEKKCTFTLVGNPMVNAGMTMRVKGFGAFDGKYIVKQCKHEVGTSGYTTKVTLRTIPGYTVETAKKKDDNKKKKGGGTGGKKTGGTWQTTSACTVYRASTGNDVVGSLSKGVPVTLLGSTKDGRTYISGGGCTGYVSSGCIGKV